MIKSYNSRITNQEPHKSAPYLRLKNGQKTSKCQAFFYSTRKTQKLDQIGAPGTKAGALKGGTLLEFSIFLSQNIQNIEGRPFGDNKNFLRKSLNAEKTERGTRWDFSTSFLQNIKKRKENLWRKKKFEKKVSQRRKKTGRRDTLVSPAIVW